MAYFDEKSRLGFDFLEMFGKSFSVDTEDGYYLEVEILNRMGFQEADCRSIPDYFRYSCPSDTYPHTEYSGQDFPILSPDNPESLILRHVSSLPADWKDNPDWVGVSSDSHTTCPVLYAYSYRENYERIKKAVDASSAPPQAENLGDFVDVTLRQRVSDVFSFLTGGWDYILIQVHLGHYITGRIFSSPAVVLDTRSTVRIMDEMERQAVLLIHRPDNLPLREKLHGKEWKLYMNGDEDSQLAGLTPAERRHIWGLLWSDPFPDWGDSRLAYCSHLNRHFVRHRLCRLAEEKTKKQSDEEKERRIAEAVYGHTNTEPTPHRNPKKRSLLARFCRWLGDHGDNNPYA